MPAACSASTIAVYWAIEDLCVRSIMETLQELVQIVTRNKLKAIDILDLQAEGKTQTSQLYQLVAAGEVQSDEEAASLLNPNAKHTAGYRKVKAKLKAKMLGALFFIDAKKPSYSDRKRAFYECQRDWAAARILMAKNAFVSSVELGHKILRHAEKYEFTDLAMESSRFLAMYYGTKKGDRRRYDEYYQLHKSYRELYNIECDIEHYYSNLVIHFVNKKSSGSTIQAQIGRTYELCLPLLARYQSYNVQLYGTLIGFMLHSSRTDYKSVLEVCHQSRAIFEQKQYQAETPLQIIYYQSLVCYIQLRHFEEGRIAAEKCLTLIEEGTFNWFKYKELYFMLCTHTGRYEDAYNLLRETTAHHRFPYLIENTREIWKVYEAYILLACWYKGAQHVFQSSNFRLARFLNEIPILSKDKKGLNVAILIAQFLLLLREKRYDEMIDRAESLYKYGVRYLQEENTRRSFYFIKLIILVVNSSFQREIAREAGKSYVNLLKDSPFTEAKQLHQLEIIPYEILWEMIIAALPAANGATSR